MSSPLPIDISLWDFSVRQYARPGVSQLCLALQDQQGINVNILLWSLWLGHRGRLLTTEMLSNAQDKICRWDVEYILPLRHMRRQIKAECGISDPTIESVRKKIKCAELLAEKYVLQLLEELSDDPQPAKVNPLELMKQNLMLYLAPYRGGDARILSLFELIESGCR